VLFVVVLFPIVRSFSAEANYFLNFLGDGINMKPPTQVVLYVYAEVFYCADVFEGSVRVGEKRIWCLNIYGKRYIDQQISCIYVKTLKKIAI